MNSKVILFVVGALIIGFSLGSRVVPFSKEVKQEQIPISITPQRSEHGEEGAQSKIPGMQHVHAIIYNADGNLLLGTHGGLFKSVDDGKTWNKIEVRGSVDSDDWMSLVSHPENRNIIFAGGHDLGVIKSEDGGLVWMRADSGIRGTDIHGLIINQRNPNLLFAYSVGNGVFKSENGANSWRRMDDGPENPGVRSLGYMAVQTSMDKSMGWDNWGLLFAGTSDGIFQSFSCFCGWTKTTETFNNTTVYTLANLHKDLTTIYAGTKDGIWKSQDEGKTWNNVGLSSIKITGIAINPKNSRILFVASEDGLIYKSQDSGQTWKQL